jgi:hypothetical protein
MARKLGLNLYKRGHAYDGYTLFAPQAGTNIFLIDMRGDVVHRWELPYRPADYGYLLESGNLLVGVRTGHGPVDFGGRGGLLLEMDWEANIVWSYEEPTLHHDFCRMENGNTMLVGWELVPTDLARRVRGGVAGTEHSQGMWSDYFREVTAQGEIVWEWHCHEHLDPEVDTICFLCSRNEWTHTNACEVLDDGNILTSFRRLDTVAIIDKQSGRLQWKWGRGDLGHQHDPTPLKNGNILIFDNSMHCARHSGSPGSRVVEVNPRTNRIEWSYETRPPWDFFSGHISGAQRLPNGNTLVCEGVQGRLFEVTREKELVWEYVNPFFADDERGTVNMVFRAYRYGPDFPGFKNKELDAKRHAWFNRLDDDSSAF